MIHPQVLNLLNRPQMVQRTEEWFLARKTRITASEVGSILGVNPYKSRNKYWIEKKCQLLNIPLERKGTFTTEHGVKYEPVIQQMIREEYKTIYVDENKNPKDPLYEFGLIPHPTISFLGASPDGILYNGRMVEIKCVVNREILEKEVVPYYYAQVQTQLECCGLDECEFTECKIIEYRNMNDFILDSECNNNDNVNEYNMWKSVMGKMKGIVIQKNSNDYVYIDELTIDTNLLPQNESDLKYYLSQFDAKNINYWYCNLFSMKLIKRNQEYIDKMIEICGLFWDTLLKENNKFDNISDNNIELKTEEEVKQIVPNMNYIHKPFYFDNFVKDNLFIKNSKKKSMEEPIDSSAPKNKLFMFKSFK